MPSVRKLSVEEIQAIENKGKGTRKITEQQYDLMLSGFEIGDYGELDLDEGDNRLTVRNRLKAAAARRNVSLTFPRTRGDMMRFKVGSADGLVAEAKNVVGNISSAVSGAATRLLNKDAEAEPVASDTPPANRPGRKKKVAA